MLTVVEDLCLVLCSPRLINRMVARSETVCWVSTCSSACRLIVLWSWRETEVHQMGDICLTPSVIGIPAHRALFRRSVLNVHDLDLLISDVVKVWVSNKMGRLLVQKGRKQNSKSPRQLKRDGNRTEFRHRK